MKDKEKLMLIYNRLYNTFGKQNWWPAQTKLEVIIGAILTQNTSWKNVEKAIFNLNKNKLININKIIEMNQKKLAELIRPAGYYNQKAERLKIVANFIKNNKNPTRGVVECKRYWS